jgi:hypothetical protein
MCDLTVHFKLSTDSSDSDFMCCVVFSRRDYLLNLLYLFFEAYNFSSELQFLIRRAELWMTAVVLRTIFPHIKIDVWGTRIRGGFDFVMLLKVSNPTITLPAAR